MQCVMKYPGIVKRAAANANGSDASLVHHSPGSLRRDDIAVSNYRNSAHCRGHCSNAVEINRSRETLFTSSAMHENRGDSNVLKRPSQIRRGEILIVPAKAHLRC